MSRMRYTAGGCLIAMGLLTGGGAGMALADPGGTHHDTGDGSSGSGSHPCKQNTVTNTFHTFGALGAIGIGSPHTDRGASGLQGLLGLPSSIANLAGGFLAPNGFTGSFQGSHTTTALGTTALGTESESITQLGNLKLTPQITTPQVTTPEITTPQISTPQISTPSITTPQVSTAQVTIPQLSLPSISTELVPGLDISTPELSTPLIVIPQLSLPSITVPSITVPSITIPSITIPSITLPAITLPFPLIPVPAVVSPVLPAIQGPLTPGIAPNAPRFGAPDGTQPAPAVVPSVTMPLSPPAHKPRVTSSGTEMGAQASFRAGYNDYLRNAPTGELMMVALPGAGGLLLLTAGGGFIGYRQARAGLWVRTRGVERFLH